MRSKRQTHDDTAHVTVEAVGTAAVAGTCRILPRPLRGREFQQKPSLPAQGHML